MIVAVSSGLVAGVGLPAEAAVHQAVGGAPPQTASVPLLAESASALAAGADTLASAPSSSRHARSSRCGLISANRAAIGSESTPASVIPQH